MRESGEPPATPIMLINEVANIIVDPSPVQCSPESRFYKHPQQLGYEAKCSYAYRSSRGPDLINVGVIYITFLY